MAKIDLAYVDEETALIIGAAARRIARQDFARSAARLKAASSVASKHPDALGIATEETILFEKAILSKMPEAKSELPGIPPGKVVTGAPKDNKINQQEEAIASQTFRQGLGFKP